MISVSMLRFIFFFGSRVDAISHICSLWDRQGHCIVSYLYGGAIASRGLLVAEENDDHRGVLASDVLLVDGIALQLCLSLSFLVRGLVRWYPNCNGTDLFPALLQHCTRQGLSFSLVLYGGTPASVQSGQKFFTDAGYHVLYAQDGYRSFDWDAYDTAKKTAGLSHFHRIVFFQGRSRIDYGLQEARTWEYKKNIVSEGWLVCNQGGSLEHSSFGGKELRAPKWVQLIKGEWLWRLFLHPRKNWKKIWYTFVFFFQWFRFRKK